MKPPTKSDLEKEIEELTRGAVTNEWALASFFHSGFTFFLFATALPRASYDE